MSQTTLAKRLGRTQQAVSLLERGERCASGRTADQLTEILGVAIPLPAVDPMQTREGRRRAQLAQERLTLPAGQVVRLGPFAFKKALRQARRRREEREKERLQAEEAARVQREAELSIYRLRQAVAMPRLRFGAFRAGRR